MPLVPALKAYGSKQGIEEDKEMEHLSQGPWGILLCFPKGAAPQGARCPPTPPTALPGTLLTVHVELNGCLLATRDGLIHATAGEDTPNVQVCRVDEQLANGGLPLPILQQFLGWEDEVGNNGGRHGQAKSPFLCSWGDPHRARFAGGAFNLKLCPSSSPYLLLRFRFVFFFF